MDNDDLVNNILRELDSNETDGGDMPEESHTEAEFPAEELVPEEESVFPEPEEIEAPPQARRSAPAVRTAPVRRRKKKKKKQRSRLPGVLILTTLIVAVSIVLSLIIIAYGKDMLGIGKDDTTHRIVVPEGASTSDIAYMLKDEGIIRSPKAFIFFSRLRKSDSAYIPGEHFIKENMAYETIIQKLTSTENGTKESVEITFPEGMTLDDMAALLEEKKVCKASDFIFTFNGGGMGCDFEERLKNTDNSLKYRRMEGYAFPDTYIFYEDMDVEEVCQKIYYNFNSKMTPERYAKMEQRKIDNRSMTLDELITLASIVQKEAATPDTMNIIASVFWNRLNDPEEFAGKLQSDPTSNYSLYIKRNLAVNNKSMVDSYDTYISPGLPPGAICNPGIEAIDAVLDAIDTDYRYFAANIYTGETKYAKTYEEHLANLDEIHAAEHEYEAKMAEDEAAKKAAGQEAQNAQ